MEAVPVEQEGKSSGWGGGAVGVEHAWMSWSWS